MFGVIQVGLARLASKTFSRNQDPKWSCTQVVATRRNPSLKAKYDQLIRAGKSGKVAVTAIKRKLIVMANALLRDGRKWSELRP
jgi:hypothetical protein